MWGGKLLATVLVASGVLTNALWWNPAVPNKIDQAASTVNRMDKFVYPGSQLISFDEYLYVMVAETSLDKATDWYRQKLDENRMTEKNLVRSDSNGNRVNWMSGTGLTGEMEVAIKEETSGIVTIAVTNDMANYQEI